jgi:hypothetical protein
MKSANLPSAILGSLLLLITGCTVTRPLHLYPTADDAVDPTVLNGLFVGHGQGHGTAKVTMPDGEVLQGEYSVVFDGSMGFGTIFGTVYGPGGSRSVIGTSTNVSIAGKGQGFASLSSGSTSMQCEFLNANMTGHGYGACKSSKGGTYRLMY